MINQAAWTYGAHPNDGDRTCAKCGDHSPHMYVGSAIRGRESDGALAESHDFTCCACGSTYAVEGDPRPELDADDFGRVFARREPDVGLAHPWVPGMSTIPPAAVGADDRATVRP